MNKEKLVVQDILEREHKDLAGMLEIEELNLESAKRRIDFCKKNIEMYVEKMKQIDEELSTRVEVV